jgi:hypothetical protein
MAGVKLKNLLWVRCRNVDQSLRATDLLLQGGGFGMVILDLSDIPAETVRQVQLNVWFRFRRAVEDTETILLLLERESNAKTCASLVLRLNAGGSHWRAPWIPGGSESRYPMANLLDGFQIHAEVLRSRIQPAAAIYKRDNFIVHDSHAAVETTFETKTAWGYPSGELAAEVETSIAP